MYCPSCGMQSPPDQKFCRSCGMDLQVTSQLLVERSGQAFGGDETRRKRIERWGKITGLSGIALIMLLVACTFIFMAISKVFGINAEAFRLDLLFPLILAISFPLLVIGAGLISYLNINKELSKKEAIKLKAGDQTTARMVTPGVGEVMPGITEGTTDLLEADDETLVDKSKERLPA